MRVSVLSTYGKIVMLDALVEPVLVPSLHHCTANTCDVTESSAILCDISQVWLAVQFHQVQE
jgi:hypothetical protein